MGIVFATLVRQAGQALRRAEDHARDGMREYSSVYVCICVYTYAYMRVDVVHK